MVSDGTEASSRVEAGSMDSRRCGDLGTAYFAVPVGWCPETANPFTDDGRYEEQWSCFCLIEGERGLDFRGRGENGLYTFQFGQDAPRLEPRLADFLRYETSHGRNVILAFPEVFGLKTLVESVLAETPGDDIVRSGDPRWVVHSTNADAWASIRADGELRALSVLREEGRTVLSIGFSELGEPPDYAEYVVLGRVDNVNPEHVVASQRKGFVFTDADAPYAPGVRLYFDNHAIIGDGLGVRDGLHTMKVLHRLPLEPYLAMAVGLSDVDAKGKIPTWTPNTFWGAANDVFFRRVGAS